MTETIPEQNGLVQLQRQLAAMACSVFRPNQSVPRYLVRTILDLALKSSAVLQCLLPQGRSQNAWQEFQNKLQVFYLFEHMDSALKVSDAEFSLPELVARAAALGPYYSVWATEGVAHFYADLKLQKNAVCADILPDNVARLLPGSAMLPFHAGMGLSLAEFLLSRADHCENAVDAFIHSCRRNSQNGYAQVAYEALGLVVRNLYPHWVEPIHRYLSSDGELLSCFWHGVGRAIYFSPLNFLPHRSAPWGGIEMCLSESPGALAQRNALAGFVWALALVNILHPEIIASFLAHHGRDVPQSDAFINGIYSAVVAWCDSAPDDSCHAALCSYQPIGICSPDLWRKYVQEPVWKARHDYQALSSSRRIGMVFRY